MPRKNGCQAPWRPAQVVSLFVWFGTVAGFYALFVPDLPSVAWQAAAAVVYGVATLGVFCAYFWVSLVDPADDTADGPLFCEHCQAYVQRRSRHCRECNKCVLGFDHHCKWVNNCIGAKNYTPFMALLTAMCAMLAIQLAAGAQLLALCFTPAAPAPSLTAPAAPAAAQDQVSWAVTARLQAAYPSWAPVSRDGYIAALCVYLTLLAVALYGLGDLWLLHLVLMARGLTTYDYIMANHDAAVAAAGAAGAGAAGAPQVGAWQRFKSLLGRRSNQVQDESVLAARAGAGAGAFDTGGASKRGLGSSPRQERTTAAAGSSPRSGGRVLVVVPPAAKKHRVSLTPCQACMTPQSAIDARHAAAYQQHQQAQQPATGVGARTLGQGQEQGQHSRVVRQEAGGVLEAAAAQPGLAAPAAAAGGSGPYVLQQQQQQQQESLAGGGQDLEHHHHHQQQQQQQQLMSGAAMQVGYSSAQPQPQSPRADGRKPCSVKFAGDMV